MIDLIRTRFRRLIITSIVLLITCSLSIKTNAQCVAPTMTFHSPVLLSGTDGQAGAIYLFAEVLPGVDAHIEVMGLYGGATLYNIDDSAGIGYYDAFQPYVGAAPNDTSFIDWKITFKVGGTSDDTVLACLAVTGVDVDGDNNSLKEFIEAATPGSIAVDPFTILNVTFDGVRSKAISTIFNIALIDTAHHEAMFQMNFTNISTLLYRNGAVSTWGAQQIRQTCIYFKPFFFHNFQMLPLKLFSFTAKQTGDFTKLQWSAGSEEEISNYIVQKSTDGKTWKDIQKLVRGISVVKNDYAVTDMEKNSGATYYRLKQNSTSGSFSYSKIIQIGSQATTSNSITHNTLVKNTINYQINGVANDEYSFEYYTSTGIKVKQDRLQIYAGLNYKSIQLPSQMTAGYYYVVVKNNKGQQVHHSSLIKN